ncbi:MAG: hypothetical protein ACK5QT_09810 [Oligoflexia bacterium]
MRQNSKKHTRQQVTAAATLIITLSTSLAQRHSHAFWGKPLNQDPGSKAPSLGSHPGIAPISITKVAPHLNPKVMTETWAAPTLGRMPVLKKNLPSLVGLASIVKETDKILTRSLPPDFFSKTQLATDRNRNASQDPNQPNAVTYDLIKKIQEASKVAGHARDLAQRDVNKTDNVPATLGDWVKVAVEATGTSLTVGEVTTFFAAPTGAAAPVFGFAAGSIAGTIHFGTGAWNLLSKPSKEDSNIVDKALKEAPLSLQNFTAAAAQQYAQLMQLDRSDQAAAKYLAAVNNFFNHAESGFGIPINPTPGELAAAMPSLFHEVEQDKRLHEFESLLNKLNQQGLEEALKTAKDPSQTQERRDAATKNVQKIIDDNKAGIIAANEAAKEKALELAQSAKSPTPGQAAEKARASNEKKAAAKAAALKAYEEFKEAALYTQAGLDALSFLGGLSNDPEVRKATYAATQIGGALLKIGLSVFAEKAEAISVALATQNYVLAAIAITQTIISLFQDPAKDPVFEYLKHISEQIGYMRQEMREGFNQLSKQIYQLGSLLAQIDYKVSQVLISQLETNTRLQHIETNLKSIEFKIDAAARTKDTWEAVQKLASFDDNDMSEINSTVIDKLQNVLPYFSKLSSDPASPAKSEVWSAIDGTQGFDKGHLPLGLEAENRGLERLPMLIYGLDRGRNSQRLLTTALNRYAFGDIPQKLPDVSLFMWLDFSAKNWVRLSKAKAFPSLLERSKPKNGKESTYVYTNFTQEILTEYQNQLSWRKFVRSPGFDAKVRDAKFGGVGIGGAFTKFLKSKNGSAGYHVLSTVPTTVDETLADHAFDTNTQRTQDRLDAMNRDPNVRVKTDSPFIKMLESALTKTESRNWPQFTGNWGSDRFFRHRPWRKGDHPDLQYSDPFNEKDKQFRRGVCDHNGVSGDYNWHTIKKDWFPRFIQPVGFHPTLNFSELAEDAKTRYSGSDMLAALSMPLDAQSIPALEAYYSVDVVSEWVDQWVSIGNFWNGSTQRAAKPIFVLTITIRNNSNGLDLQGLDGTYSVCKFTQTAAFLERGVSSFGEKGPKDLFWKFNGCSKPNVYSPGVLAVNYKRLARQKIHQEMRTSLAKLLRIFRSGATLPQEDIEFLGPELSHFYGLGYAAARAREFAMPMQGQLRYVPEEIKPDTLCHISARHLSQNAFLEDIERLACRYEKLMGEANKPGRTEQEHANFQREAIEIGNHWVRHETTLGWIDHSMARALVLSRGFRTHPEDDRVLKETISTLKLLKEQIKAAEEGGASFPVYSSPDSDTPSTDTRH